MDNFPLDSLKRSMNLSQRYRVLFYRKPDMGIPPEESKVRSEVQWDRMLVEICKKIGAIMQISLRTIEWYNVISFMCFPNDIFSGFIKIVLLAS